MKEIYQLHLHLPCVFDKEDNAFNYEEKEIMSTIDQVLKQEGIKDKVSLGMNYFYYEEGQPGWPMLPSMKVRTPGGGFEFFGFTNHREMKEYMLMIADYIKLDMKKQVLLR